MERVQVWLRTLLTVPTGIIPEASVGGLVIAVIVALLRKGRLGTGWAVFIGVLAAPVERDLCKSENKSLRTDNERMEVDIKRKDAEIDRLRRALGYSDESNVGHSASEDGMPS